MIRRIASVAAAMMARMARVAHRSLNNRRCILRDAEARARGMTGAQKERGDRQKHLPCGDKHGR